MALGAVAGEARLRTAEQQAAGAFSWIGTHDPERLPDEQRSRMNRIHNFQLGGPEKIILADASRHALQENGWERSTAPTRMGTTTLLFSF